MLDFILTAPLRVRSSKGVACFTIPGTGVVLEADQDLAGHWLNLPEGTRVQACATFEKTDTFLCAVTLPAHDDDETGDWVPSVLNGVVFRRGAWTHITEAAASADFESVDEDRGEAESESEDAPESEATAVV